MDMTDDMVVFISSPNFWGSHSIALHRRQVSVFAALKRLPSPLPLKDRWSHFSR